MRPAGFGPSGLCLAVVLAALVPGLPGAARAQSADQTQQNAAPADPLAPIPLVLDPYGTVPPPAPPADATAGGGFGATPGDGTAGSGLGPQIAPHAMGPLTNSQTSMAPKVTAASGAVLRGLDKVAGSTTDIPLKDGQTVDFGTLKVKLSDCRFPSDNPSADAYAHLTITESGKDRPAQQLFDGWMVASSPALSALDHPRYDIWVVRCNNS